MWDKLEKIEEKFNELEQTLSDPTLVQDQKRYRDVVRKHSELTDVVELIRHYRKVTNELKDTEEMRDAGGEMADLAEEELPALKDKLEKLEADIKLHLIPRDPYDGKNVFMEVRAGTGGDEAALFCGELFRMYSRFAETKRWKVGILDSNQTELGGYKEIVFQIEGKDVYREMKFEAGVHRVQRVPTTETSGRIHTSAVTVAVLPEMDELDVSINANDIRVDIFCSSGPGGQSVNTTYSAIRLTHLPTGIVVQCQDERSQTKNKAKAMKVLTSRLQQVREEEQSRELAADRKSQVGSGDRSEKIRTYNYPQNRVTDHRIGVSMYNLDAFMNGDVSEMLQKLQAADQATKLAGEEG